MDFECTPSYEMGSAETSIAYDGTWGYYPLVVTLANTGEVLRLVLCRLRSIRC